MMRVPLLLMAVAALCLGGISHADDRVKLPGNAFSVEEAEAKSNAVFVGQFTRLGGAAAVTMSESLMSGALIEATSIYKGSSVPADASYFLDIASGEQQPKEEARYVFFVMGKEKSRVLKLLSATHDNIVAAMLAVLKAKAHAKLLEIQKEKQGNGN